MSEPFKAVNTDFIIISSAKVLVPKVLKSTNFTN